MKRVIGIIVFLAIVAGIAGVSFYLGNNKVQKTAAASEKTSPLHSIMKDDVVIGDKKAPITIVEYSSLSCPHCRAFHAGIFPDIKSKYIDTGVANFVRRPFPLNEPALRAAMLVSCVGPERTTTFTDVLFELQDKWAYSNDFLDHLQKIAAVGGVPEEQFSSCMTNAEVEEKILKGRKEAVEALDIQATPTIFVNGIKLEGRLDIKRFDNVITGLQEQY